MITLSYRCTGFFYDFLASFVDFTKGRYMGKSKQFGKNIFRNRAMVDRNACCFS